MAKKILIIDDSALMRRVISDIINQSNDYEVAAIARDGLEGLDMIVTNPFLYSAVILDINMPKLNGLQLLKKLQELHIDQTIIVVSTVAKEGARETIEALENGAFDFITKPENYLETKGEAFKNKIQEMLDVATNTRKELDRIKKYNARHNITENDSTKRQPGKFNSTSEDILKRRQRGAEYIARKTQKKYDTPTVQVEERFYSGLKKNKSKIVALACSTGGPKSLQQVIPYIPKGLDAGIVLVQHMPAGFTASLAQRLNELSNVSVKEAEEGDVIKKGCVYIAPGGKHIKVVKKGTEHRIEISDLPAVEGLKPCANIMYESLKDCAFDEITGVVLTGMGADGTKGIKTLKQNNKKIFVIAQDEQSSVVYGMPKAVANAGLVDEVVSLSQVAEAITKNVGVI